MHVLAPMGSFKSLKTAGERAICCSRQDSEFGIQSSYRSHSRLVAFHDRVSTQASGRCKFPRIYDRAVLLSSCSFNLGPSGVVSHVGEPLQHGPREHLERFQFRCSTPRTPYHISLLLPSFHTLYFFCFGHEIATPHAHPTPLESLPSPSR